jgi:hypothetical protein
MGIFDSPAARKATGAIALAARKDLRVMLCREVTVGRYVITPRDSAATEQR